MMTKICNAVCDGEGDRRVCTFKVTFDPFASETGYFKFHGEEACDGPQPTLVMYENTRYVFEQFDVTNWYHPIGFGYFPDGALDDQPELEPTQQPPSGTLCPNEVCQFPQYQLNGENLCLSDPCEEGDFGLDAYEGIFFTGKREAWINAGNFSVSVTITDPETKEFFYFCHVHHKMSGRIKIMNENGTIKAPEDLIPIPYNYYVPDEFDNVCGTHNISMFQQGKGYCSDLSFLCGDVDDTFAQCMHALDCAMHVEMQTQNDQDAIAVFMRQMIPHHRNAVNMARALLKIDSSVSEDPEVEDLLWNIINSQNAQITYMRDWLDSNAGVQFASCDHNKNVLANNKSSPDDEIVPGLIALVIVAVLVAIVSVFWARHSVAAMKHEKMSHEKSRRPSQVPKSSEHNVSRV